MSQVIMNILNPSLSRLLSSAWSPACRTASFLTQAPESSVRSFIFSVSRTRWITSYTAFTSHAFLGSSLLAFLFARRSVLEELSTWAGWRQLSLARLCLVLIFADSWLFLASSGILIHGVGLELDAGSCSMAIFTCIILYTTSKALIYLFLSAPSNMPTVDCNLTGSSSQLKKSGSSGPASRREATPQFSDVSGLQFTLFASPLLRFTRYVS